MSKNVNSFRDLEVYQLSLELATDIYELVKKFPSKEKFNIINQLIRAVCSIGANIAEGWGRFHTKDFIKFLYNARGSLMEVLHFLILSHKLEYISENELTKLNDKIILLSIKLNNFIKSLSRRL